MKSFLILMPIFLIFLCLLSPTQQRFNNSTILDKFKNTNLTNSSKKKSTTNKIIKYDNIHSYIILSRLFAYESRFYPLLVNLGIIKNINVEFGNSKIMKILIKEIGNKMTLEDAIKAKDAFDISLKSFFEELNRLGTFSTGNNTFAYKLFNSKKAKLDNTDAVAIKKSSKNNTNTIDYDEDMTIPSLISPIEEEESSLNKDEDMNNKNKNKYNSTTSTNNKPSSKVGVSVDSLPPKPIHIEPIETQKVTPPKLEKTLYVNGDTLWEKIKTSVSSAAESAAHILGLR